MRCTYGFEACIFAPSLTEIPPSVKLRGRRSVYRRREAPAWLDLLRLEPLPCGSQAPNPQISPSKESEPGRGGGRSQGPACRLGRPVTTATPGSPRGVPAAVTPCTPELCPAPARAWLLGCLWPRRHTGLCPLHTVIAVSAGPGPTTRGNSTLPSRGPDSGLPLGTVCGTCRFVSGPFGADRWGPPCVDGWRRGRF